MLSAFRDPNYVLTIRHKLRSGTYLLLASFTADIVEGKAADLIGFLGVGDFMLATFFVRTGTALVILLAISRLTNIVSIAYKR